MTHRIGIIGTGGVGGYFGGKLAKAFENDPDKQVYFIARGEHLKKIREEGLLLSTSEEGDFICQPDLATDRIEDLSALDVCLICVKSYDLSSVLKRLKSVVNHKTVLIPLLNGVDIYDRVRNVIKSGIVFAACVYVGTHIEHPGKVTQKGGTCEILFGKDPQNDEIVPHDVFTLFDQSRIKYKWLEDPRADIWEKFLFIAAYGMVGAANNQTLGQILEDDSSSQDVLSIMRETVILARKLDVILRDTIIEESFQKARQFSFETKCSFQRDFEKADKPDERNLFGGTIIRLGEQLGVDVPVTRSVQERLEVMKQ